MLSLRTSSLFRETLNSLLLSGVALFACGLFVSQRFADHTGMQVALLVTAVGGGLWLVLATDRIRNRLATTDSLERQLVAFSTHGSEPPTPFPALQPLVNQGVVSQGWNRVVKVIEDLQLDHGIERRLEQTTSSRTAEKFARALRSLAEGIAISDQQGKISYVNPAWRSLLGLDFEDDSLKDTPSVLSCLETVDCTNWEDVQALLWEGTRPLSVLLHRGDSVHDGVLQISRLPLEGRVNEAEGFVWTLKDVTQNALARAAHEQFLSSATHELRTPLTNIRAYTESLLEIEDISAEQQNEFFNIIHAEAGRLGRLLNQLLDIQQLEAGSMTIQVAPFDILRMVQEVQEHINPLVAQKKLEFTCRIAPSLKTISADKEKLTSCLVNLLGNAIKYTPEGGEVRLIADEFDSQIVLSVEDTGIGIAEEELPKVFDRFYRCQDQRVAEMEGNGLGLSFCLEVARLHHGELTVESQLDQGSRFTLRLPLPDPS